MNRRGSDRGGRGLNLSPIHHGVAIAFHISGMVLGWGDIVLILLQLRVIVVD